MERRRFLSCCASLVFSGVFALQTRRAVAQALSPGLWAMRRVRPGDEDQLLQLMKSCVDDADSFHGLCNAIEWTATWADEVVNNRPRSIVLTLNQTIVAYFDLPSAEPKVVGDEIIDHHRRAFWCGAAGVRMDLLGKEHAVQVFQRLLFEAFSDARGLGYEFVRAAAPWEQHPYLPQPFKEYPGLTVQEFPDEKGETKFLLEWRLMDAVETLARAGAGKTLG